MYYDKVVQMCFSFLASLLIYLFDALYVPKSSRVVLKQQQKMSGNKHLWKQSAPVISPQLINPDTFRCIFYGCRWYLLCIYLFELHPFSSFHKSRWCVLFLKVREIVQNKSLVIFFMECELLKIVYLSIRVCAFMYRACVGMHMWACASTPASESCICLQIRRCMKQENDRTRALLKRPIHHQNTRNRHVCFRGSSEHDSGICHGGRKHLGEQEDRKVDGKFVLKSKVWFVFYCILTILSPRARSFR